MREPKSWLRALLLVISVVLVFASPAASQSGWKDKLRNKAQAAKESVQRLKDTGKKSFGPMAEAFNRTKAHAKEQPQKLRSRVESGVSRAKKAWTREAETRDKLAKRTRTSLDTLRKRAGDAGHKLKSAVQNGKAALERVLPPERRRAIRASIQKAKDEYGPRVFNALRNPENQRKALVAIGALCEIRARFREARYQSTYKIIESAGQIRITTDGHGSLTLTDLARRHMLREMPYLAGTPIANDPAASLAHLVTGDTRYFVEELPIIKRGGSSLTLKHAIVSESPFSSASTLKCLAILEAADRVSKTMETGEGSLEALDSVVHAIESARK